MIALGQACGVSWEASWWAVILGHWLGPVRGKVHEAKVLSARSHGELLSQ